MVCYNQIECVWFTILQQWKLSVNIHRYHWGRHVRLEFNIQIIGVFIFNFGRHHIPCIGNGLELDEDGLTVGVASHNLQYALILFVAVGTDNELVVTFRQVVHRKQSIGIGDARGHRFQGVVALHRHVCTRQMRAMAVVGVPGVFVRHIHHQRAGRIGNGGNAVRNAHAFAAFAVDGKVARIANEISTVSYETDGHVCGIMHRQRGQRVASHHRHPRQIGQRDEDVARRARAVVVDLEIHYLAPSTSHRGG